MKENHSNSNFLVGFSIALLFAAVVWYWQKSTDAEEGALDLLDRLADAEAQGVPLFAPTTDKTTRSERIVIPHVERVVGDETAVATYITASPSTESDIEADDLQRVKGIGPVFAERLQANNVVTVAQLRQLTAVVLAEMLSVTVKRAETILIAAQAV